jgi:hypothetical protein
VHDGSSSPRRARHLIVIFVLLVIATGAATLIFPVNPVRQHLRTSLTSWLKLRFGSGAGIGQVAVGWRDVVLHDVVLPLDRVGSQLRIERVDVGIDPVHILKRPDRLERVIKSLRMSRAIIFVVPGEKAAAGADTNMPWLPQFEIPSALFSTLGRLDSLTRIELDDGELLIGGGDRAPLSICGLRCEISQVSRGEFQIAANGRYLNDPRQKISVTGMLSAGSGSLDAQVLAEIPEGQLPGVPEETAAVTTAGGRVSVRVSSLNGKVEYRGALAVDRASLSAAFGSITAPAVRAELVGDTVKIDSLEVESESLAALTSGMIVLKGPGHLALDGVISARDLSRSLRQDGPASTVTGSAQGEFSVQGDLANPGCRLTLGGKDITVFGKPFRDVQSAVTISRTGVALETLSFRTDEGRAHVSGGLIFGRETTCTVRGEFVFEKPVELLGWASNLKSVAVTASGPVSSPDVRLSFQADSNRILGSGTIHSSAGGWDCDITSARSGSSRISIASDSDGVAVSAIGAQSLLAMLFEDLQPMARSLQSFDVRYRGRGGSGNLECDLNVTPDSSQFWTQLARELHFAGRFDGAGTPLGTFSGTWSGFNGEGQPFEGQADISIADRVLKIDHFYVDAVGDLKGSVDFSAETVDLELGINGLTLDRLPVKPPVIHRARASGTISGLVRVTGRLNEPGWNASLAMIDGSVLGVPGYWLNLDASGKASTVNIRSFELGRDVRKILDATGKLDVARDEISVIATVGAARAEDFVLALLGRGGLVTGEFRGQASVSGKLSSPDVNSQFTVHDGELFDEIGFSEFSARVLVAKDSLNRQSIRVEDCQFSKGSTYAFKGNAAIVPGDQGALKVHAEGEGDFLDIVGQLESSFHPQGSRGSLSVDIGGTLAKPKFSGALLTLRDGQFSYRDATPEDITTNIYVRIIGEGVVDSGLVSFRAGEQFVEVKAIPECATSTPVLEPLVITAPHVCLGVLEATTGVTGMPLKLPGFMKPDWLGNFVFGASAGQPVTISGYGEGRLMIAGDVSVRNARITYPFVGTGRSGGTPGRTPPVARWLLQRLEEAKWNLNVAVGAGSHYDIEVTGLKNSDMLGPVSGTAVYKALADYLDHLSIDCFLDPTNTPLQLRGTIQDTTFRVSGRVTSSRGQVVYLDQTFDIDYVSADFDETNVTPVLEGRAKTMGADSLARRIPVYLTMYQIDRETNTRVKRGRLDNVTFVLESDAAESPEQALKLLGYDVGTVGGKAEQLAASSFARAIGRQWLDPLERRIERWTYLDEVAFIPGGGQSASLLSKQRWAKSVQDSLIQRNSAVRFFTGSQVTVGKYVTPDLFLTYTGELSEGQVQLGNRLGLIHLWSAEYRINPLSRDLVLDLAVQYDELVRRRDESVSLKYSFPLEP